MYNLEKFNDVVEPAFSYLQTLIDYEVDENFEQVYEAYLKNYNVISNYNSLRLSANTMDSKAKKDYERLGNLDKALRPKFESNKHLIKDKVIQREIKHLNKEQYLTQAFAQAGSNAWEKYYDYLISTVNYKGENIIPLIAALESSDYDTRTKSFEKIKLICQEHENSFAFSLNAIKKQAEVVTELRGFENVIDMSLFDSKVKKETLNSLSSELEQNKDIFNNFLKINNIRRYCDIQAQNESTLTFTYVQACDLVLEAFKEYDLDLYLLAKKMIDNDYIDTYPRNNKSNGAFCSSFSIIDESRILLNFTGTLNDVFTLAHELGHAYHFSILKELPKIHQKYPMPLAESASNLCEVILYHHIKDKYPEAKMQRKLDLTYMFLDIYTRFLFEDEVINKRKQGELSSSELNEIFAKHQKEVFDLDEINPYMWIIKPHYYDANYNYYNFPYMIGCVIANELYTRNIDEVKEFLRLTGKKEVEELIKFDFNLFFKKIKEEFYE